MLNFVTSRLESHMAPPSESTKLESSEGLVEYVGSGKLKDKKVLITGGEYVLKEEYSCRAFADNVQLRNRSISCHSHGTRGCRYHHRPPATGTARRGRHETDGGK